MTPDTQLSPSEWDSLLNTTDDPAQLMTRFDDLSTVHTARRYLMAAVATRKPDIISHALRRVESVYPGVHGARLLALGQLGQPEAIQAAPVPERTVSPEELEDACDEALARGISARGLRLFETASAQLTVALFLSKTLGMVHRQQHVMLELAQVLTVQGKPNPEMIEEALAMPIKTTERRRVYGAEAWAEACMALGDYRTAMQLVMAQPQPYMGLYAFLGAMLGIPETKDAETLKDSYPLLAKAVWAIREGRGVDMPELTPNSPEAEYGGIFRAVMMLQTRPMFRQARRALQSLAPLTPEQKVWQLAGLIQACAISAGEFNVLQLMEEFAAALDRLRTRDYVLQAMRALMPEAYMLLGLLPAAHPDVEDTLPTLPLLTGECLTYQYRTHKLPGKAAGSAVLVWTAATGEDVKIHRMAESRVREKLPELGHSQLLNIGVVLQVLNTFRQASPPAQFDAWDAALHRALEWVDSDVLRRDLVKRFNKSQAT